MGFLKENYRNVCRYCLGNEDLVNIYIKDDLKFKFIEEVFECNYVEFSSDDSLPNFICSKCLSSIKEWHKFKQKCNFSKNILEKLIDDFTVKEENFVEITISEEESNEAFSIKLENSESASDEEKKITAKSNKPRSKKAKAAKENKPKKKYSYRYTHQCPICGKMIKKRLNEHLIIHSVPDGRPFKCDSCDKSYCTKRALQGHVESIHLQLRYPCDQCDKIMTSKMILKQHKEAAHDEKKYKCDICSDRFGTIKYLRKHKEIHTGVRKHTCTDCGKSFRVSGALKDHTRIHTGEKPYACKICTKDFRTSKLLKQHNRTHTGEKPFKCPCGACYGNKKALDTHKKQHIQEPANSSIEVWPQYPPHQDVDLQP